MPDLTPDEMIMLELDAAWQAYCDHNAEAMAELERDHEQFYRLAELAFKAGYTSGVQGTLAQLEEQARKRKK